MFWPALAVAALSLKPTWQPPVRANAAIGKHLAKAANVALPPLHKKLTFENVFLPNDMRKRADDTDGEGPEMVGDAGVAARTAVSFSFAFRLMGQLALVSLITVLAAQLVSLLPGVLPGLGKAVGYMGTGLGAAQQAAGSLAPTSALSQLWGGAVRWQARAPPHPTP